jgi:hypothetical protein
MSCSDVSGNKTVLYLFYNPKFETQKWRSFVTSCFCTSGKDEVSNTFEMRTAPAPHASVPELFEPRSFGSIVDPLTGLDFYPESRKSSATQIMVIPLNDTHIKERRVRVSMISLSTEHTFRSGQAGQF